MVLFLGLDVFLMRRDANKDLSFKKIIALNLLWLSIAIVFLIILLVLMQITNSSVDARMISETGLTWATGFLIEKALAVDNIFVFLLIFTALGIDDGRQRTLLLYGIVGAIVLRLLMIFLAAHLIMKFEWILIVFGVLLVWMGYKSWPLNKEGEEETPGLIDWIKRIIKVKDQEGYFSLDKSEKFGFYITTSLLALVVVAVTDIIFAVDSIPAIFAISTDSFIVASSNVYAVLGMAPMYFLLREFRNKLIYLPHALSIILVFIGIKLLLTPLIKISILISLGFILVVLLVATVLSLRK